MACVDVWWWGFGWGSEWFPTRLGNKGKRGLENKGKRGFGNKEEENLVPRVGGCLVFIVQSRCC